MPSFNVPLEGLGRRRLATSRGSKSDRTRQHSRSYSGPAVKRWTLREVSMYWGRHVPGDLTGGRAQYPPLNDGDSRLSIAALLDRWRHGRAPPGRPYRWCIQILAISVLLNELGRIEMRMGSNLWFHIAAGLFTPNAFVPMTLVIEVRTQADARTEIDATAMSDLRGYWLPRPGDRGRYEDAFARLFSNLMTATDSAQNVP